MTLSARPQPPLLADHVYDVLREAIVNGELPAGTRLRIRDLAEQVGTSVMPVREAIRRLEEGGFATREPHKGAVVRGLTLEELADVYAVRQILEHAAVRLGTQRATDEVCEVLERELALMREAIDAGRVDDHLRHDEQLLSTLYAAGGNAVLVRTIEDLWAQCRAYKITGIKAILDDPSDHATLWTFQHRIVEAARAGDGEQAAVASAESLATALEDIRARLAVQQAAERPR